MGNIPYDTTEEKLRDIFSAVGPVISFRIVFDRETGKPKGYGFCEYKDQETATSAIRNLNGQDLNGRQLRVDSASNERARDEPDIQQQQIGQQQQQQQQQQQPQSGSLGMPGDLGQSQLQNQGLQHAEPLVDPQTVINNVLCSLPPEQLFDVCKQLKTSLLINPNETRQLLAQNPQLNFAILQSLVMIKAIDAETAMNTLHKQLVQPAPLQPTTMPMMTNMVQPPMLQPFPFVAGPPQPAPTAPMPQVPTSLPDPNQQQQGPPLAAPMQGPLQGPPQGPLQGIPQANQIPIMSAPDITKMNQASVDPRMASADPRIAAAAAAAAALNWHKHS